MRAAVTAFILVLAHVAQAGPLRVTIECEEEGRTKACPAFLLGFVDANKVLLVAPRASADVVVYANAQEVALVDRVHLRFVGNVAGAPPVVETEADVDSRADDDTQREQLEPAFLRGMALYVAARYPKLVTIAFAAPDGAAVTTTDEAPWDLALTLGGFGNWTSKYQSFQGSTNLSLSHLDRTSRIAGALGATGGLNRQPSLVADDGTMISVNSRQWELTANLGAAWLYDGCWSFGGMTKAWRDDPKGQYRYGWNARAGVEWDRYPADDPRGNRLAVLYLAGYQVDGYNLRDVLGERFAQYPIHALIASGAVRKDKVTFGLSLAVGAEVLHPLRRHNISASPFVEWKLGGHVDLEMSFSITKRQVVAPDPNEIDPMDYEQLSRLSYAEPLAMNGTLSLDIHWDRTNGARNDRFTDL